ncbi:MAG: hypothetical protein M1481_01165 [Candidatus Thermoplasmatota archaeon]|jgi:hypothetical protein|nr:hypothetical protein [Candidatus Thermoplasmatota archaeon]MCL5963680.1 hypothetical protein [Candidatus Thermoplasmatota archaeon]
MSPKKELKGKSKKDEQKMSNKDAKKDINAKSIKKDSNTSTKYEIEFPNEFGGHVKMLFDVSGKSSFSIFNYIIPEGISDEEALEYYMGEKEIDDKNKKMQLFAKLPFTLKEGSITIDTSDLIDKYISEEESDFVEENISYAFEMLNKFIDLIDETKNEELSDDSIETIAKKMGFIKYMGVDEILDDNDEIELEDKHIMASALCTLLGEFEFGDISDFMISKNIENIVLSCDRTN